MSLNLTAVDTPSHPEWLPNLDVQLFESDRELTTPEGTSRYVIVVTGYNMTWAGLANEDTEPIGGFDGIPEVVLPYIEDVQKGLERLEEIINETRS